MGKARKAKSNRAPSKPYSKAAPPKPKASSSRKPAPPPSSRPTIPFESAHRILLVGEGDFSFSHCLLSEHGCSSLVATCFDSRSALLEKYPQAAKNLEELEAEEGIRILYNVDATKLSKGGKEVKRGGFDRIVFNFPHVGGLTKDVNRQVRHNQELLVGFFSSAISLLADHGLIVVTIFEGEPYTLWNVRDLARHVGLKVERSFKFDAKAYPGYKHSRTLGNIRDGGGWKGEERPSRTYIFKNQVQEDETVSKKQLQAYNSDDSND